MVVSQTSASSGIGARARPERLFPVIRHLSWRLTPYLARTSITPNEVTLASFVAGLAAAWLLAQGTYGWAVAGSVLLIACYVLDNCDGELARLRNRATRFGDRFDSFVDWAVHSAVFMALGIGATRQTGNEVWLWLGALAALGGTINYVLVSAMAARASRAMRPIDVLAFALRELGRADFCFLVLLASLVNAAWLLLAAGAVGAQLYWALALVDGARDRHV